ILPARTRVGPYIITGLIDTGGMGQVYRALDTTLKRDVAIKTLPDTLVADPERRSRFEREALVLATLNHPNVGAIYAVEHTPDGALALILELVEGQTLAERVSRRPLPIKDALAIAIQISDGIGAAHKRGIIHRDLKPANVKITPEGLVKVLDFGLAQVS